MSDLFSGFSTQTVPGDGADIFVRTGGEGPPLLLLHGFPQNHVMWHSIAARLARRFTVILPDSRGCGHSSCPPNDDTNEAYSKRVMARDMVSVMTALGHGRFHLAGHDRGGRVAYRLALDHPEKVERLAVLDISSTEDTWQAFDPEFAMTTYHWPFLAQDAPLPETLIGADPAFYLRWSMASWTGSGDLSAFSPDAMAAYESAFKQPERIAAMCNDYRAGATFDRDADKADLAAGNKIACPLLVLWGNHGIPAKAASTPEQSWHKWCDDVTAAPIDSGHFVVEENPEATLAAMLDFFAGG